jgi:sec-independent protein translocase protein TatC
MDTSKGEMPFLDHLEELRWRILWSLAAIVVGAAIGMYAVIHFDVVEILKAPLYDAFDSIAREHPELAPQLVNRKLVFLSLTDAFFFTMKLGVIIGLLLASPVVVYQMWGFFAPALEPHERRVIVPSMTLGLVLFAAGVAFSYFVALPLTVRFLLGFSIDSGFDPNLTVSSYMGQVFSLLLTFGVVFELPVVIMILSFLGLVTPAFLRAKRRHAIVGMLVTACALSPGDMVTLALLLMVPLVVLYELSIVLSTIVRRERIDATPLLIPMIAMYELRRMLLRRRVSPRVA